MKKKVLFVSNFSDYLNETEECISSYLENKIEYKILTYKISQIKKSLSYEAFLIENYDKVRSISEFDIQKKYPDTNFTLSIVAERFFSDYYFLGGALGHKKINFKDQQFFVKSLITFLETHIKESEIVFSGYPDNIISHLTFLICDKYNKRCISFGPKNIINHNRLYLTETIYARPVENLKNQNEELSIQELSKYISNYDMSKQLKAGFKKTKGLDKPFLDIFSPNIFNLKYWKYTLFGYSASNKKIKIFLEIDRANLFSKLTSSFVKSKNTILCKFFYIFQSRNERSTKFIYFPLQVQPEASTSVVSPYFMNILSTVEYISKSLPIGYKLVVKDHPGIRGRRSISTLRKIKSLANVTLVNPSTPSKELIKESELIIGFGGTTLIEAIFHGKKILIFDESFYSDSGLVRKLQNFKNLHREILDLINLSINNTEIEADIHKMLNFFHQRGFPRFENPERNMAENFLRLINEKY